MNPYFDTHCHLQSPHFDPDRDAVLTRAADAGVDLLTIGTTVGNSRLCVELADAHPHVFAAIGIHPNDTHHAAPDAIDHLRALAKTSDHVRAIGETGLDYFHEHAPRSIQAVWFGRHLELATELGLPVILHARESAGDMLDQVEPFLRNGGRAVWHCFVAGKKQLPRLLDRALDLGLYLGISGLVTFEDQKPLRAILPRIPDAHLLLDTDAPYLIPRPKTLSRNEPSSAVRICEELARLRDVSPADMARITTRNARTLLALPLPATDAQRIAYPIRESLYLNLTNECTNDCLFCARNRGYVVKGHDIRLDRPPTPDELIAAIGDPAPYKEVVFCGFGEPTLRLETLLRVAAWLHTRGIRVRLNTNGLANAYFARDIAPELYAAGVRDVSISLNTPDPVEYHRLCRSRFGRDAHGHLLAFARACLDAGLRTTLSVVDMPGIDIDAARRCAENVGADFRVRSFVDAG